MNDEAYQVATPLFRAIEKGASDTVRELLAAGADPHECNGEDEDSALLIAAMEGKEAIVRLLLEAGAHADHGDAHGYTPLMGAVCADSLPVVQLLLAAGADANRRASRSGATALHDAAGGGHLEIAKALLKAGANPNAPENHEGMTVLMCAIQSLCDAMVQLLLEAGADASVATRHGDTAREFAQHAQEYLREPAKKARMQRIQALLQSTFAAPHAAH